MLLKKMFRLCAVVLLLSCTPPEGTRFDKHDVSFTVPGGWKITDEDDLGGKGYYLSCEKSGISASGLVTMSWVNDSMDLATMVANYGDAVKKNFILKKAHPKMGPIVQTSYSGHDAMGTEYTLKLLGVAHSGHIFCFYGDHKTITVMMQEADEDHPANKPGFDLVTRTFTCR